MAGLEDVGDTGEDFDFDDDPPLCTVIEPNISHPPNQLAEYTAVVQTGESCAGTGVAAGSGGVGIHTLYTRCVVAGVRSWATTTQQVLTACAGARHAVKESLLIGLTGMHSAIPPNARPTWRARVRLLQLSTSCVDTMLANRDGIARLAPMARECVRRSLAAMLCDDMATRAAWHTLEWRSCTLACPPEATAPVGLEAAMTVIVDTAPATEVVPSTAGTVFETWIATICTRLAAPAWIGRTTSTTMEPRAVDVAGAIFASAFRANFIPFWKLAHLRNVRAIRLDKAQYDGVHRASAAIELTASLDVPWALSVQRLALRNPSAALLTEREVLSLFTANPPPKPPEMRARSGATVTASRPSLLLCDKLEAAVSAAALHYCRVAWVGEQTLVANLGPTVRCMHALALASRYGVFLDDRSDIYGTVRSIVGANEISTVHSSAIVNRLVERVNQLPLHARALCVCTECRRVANGARRSRAAGTTTQIAADMHRAGDVGIVATMVERVDRGLLYCSKRSSAALRSALAASSAATQKRVECVAVEDDEDVLEKGRTSPVFGGPLDEADCVDDEMHDEEDDDVDGARGNLPRGSCLSRMRRDAHRCFEQRREPLSCGDLPMTIIPCVGKAVRVFGTWYTLCCFCGVVVTREPRHQLLTFPSCISCLHTARQLRRTPQTPTAPSSGVETCQTADPNSMEGVLRLIVTRMDKYESNIALQPISLRMTSEMQERPSDRTCRFCGRVAGRRGVPFTVLLSPLDRKGANECRSPEQRITRWCPAHSPPWLPDALRVLPSPLVLAHIASNARPVLPNE